MATLRTLAERLVWARETAKLTQTSLAKASGVAQSTIAGLESGYRMGSAKLPQIAYALGVDPIWLATGKGTTMIGNTAPGPEIRGSVPLISWVQAGDYAEAIDHLSPGDGEPIPTVVPVKRYTYALRVTGDSMEPEFPEGCIIIVEPEMEPRHGDYIIVKNGHNEATFKQLIQDGSDWYLKPINPRYPVKPLPKGAVFCGVVRGMERRFR